MSRREKDEADSIVMHRECVRQQRPVEIFCSLRQILHSLKGIGLGL